MSFLTRHLMIGLMFFAQLSHADLPNDADRSLNVRLAGFLYSQGVYKTRNGTFALVDQTSSQDLVSQNDESLAFPSNPQESKEIQNWIRSTNTKIKLQELLSK